MAGEVPPGPRRGGRTPGVAQVIPGPQPLAPAQRHTEVRGGGAARRDLTQVPAPAAAPPWARPHEGPPPPAAPGGLATRLSLARHSVSGPLRRPRHPSPPPAIRALPALRRGLILRRTLRPGGWGGGRSPRPTPRTASRRGAGGGSPAPSAGARDSRPASWPASPGPRSFSSCWLECGRGRARCPPPGRLVPALPPETSGKTPGREALDGPPLLVK